MANPELGAKQLCPNCQTKFYDLNRRPAHCPKCAHDFDPEEAVRSRRVRTRSTPADYEADEPAAKPRTDEEEGESEDETVDAPELDEPVEAEPLETDDVDEAGTPAPPEPELGVDFEEEAAAEEEGEDVPFLEEEEDEFPDDEIGDLPDEEEH